MRRMVSGRAAVPGVGVGVLRDWDALLGGRADVNRPAESTDELRRLEAAVAHADAELAALQVRLGRSDSDAILEFQRELLRDPELWSHVMTVIGKVGAEAALSAATEHFASLLEALDDPQLRERSADVRDVSWRVMRALSGAENAVVGSLSEGASFVLVARSFFPSDLLEIGRERLAGLCLIGIGVTSHVVQLARALGVPTVLANDSTIALAEGMRDGVRTLVDGTRGQVVFDCDDADVAAARRAAAGAHESERTSAVRITAAAGSVAEAEAARARGAAGIGLLRTEFLFGEPWRTSAPSVAEQGEAYRRIARMFPQDSVTIRLFDAGGDKPLPFLRTEAEVNPALGRRGIRLLLDHEQVLRDQLHAIAAATEQHSGIRVLVPFVTDVEELRRAREMYDDVCTRLPLQSRPPFGVMIEVPAAALMVDVLADLVDFLSIGTNDLAQYVLAADRDGARYASYGDALHPAVLRLVDMAVRAAKERGKPVSVCGEAAGRSEVAATLIDCGVDELVTAWSPW